MLQALSDLLRFEGLAQAVIDYSFFWPFCEVIHFVGLTMLIGTVGMFDLRLLGVAKSVPIGALHRLLPWGIAGFVLTLMTGFVFVAGDSFKEPIVNFRNLSFQLKMLFLFLAGVNALAFYVTGLARKVEHLGAGADAPLGAKVIAGTSLFLWIGVMYFGRMLPWADGLWMLFNAPG